MLCQNCGVERGMAEFFCLDREQNLHSEKCIYCLFPSFENKPRTRKCTPPQTNAMVTIGQIHRQIKKWRKNGKSYNWISAQLGISKPEIRRLMDPAHKPGRKIKKKLGIECTPRPPKVIPRLGQDGWEKRFFKKINPAK